MAKDNPIVEFDKNGQASVLRYDMPLQSGFIIERPVEIDLSEKAYKVKSPPKVDRQLSVLLNDAEVSIPDLANSLLSQSVYKVDTRNDAALLQTFTTASEVINESAAAASDSASQPVDDELAFSDDLISMDPASGLNVGDNTFTFVGVNSGNPLTPIVSQPLNSHKPMSGNALPTHTVKTTKNNSALAELLHREGPLQVASKLKDEYVFVESESLLGDYRLDLLPAPEPAKIPKIRMIERIKLSNFLGDYGAGRTIESFSLLPGEAVEMSVRSYNRQETTTTSSQSILESHENEVADEFAQSLDKETQDKTSSELDLAAQMSVKGSYRAKTNANLSIGKFGGGAETEAKLEAAASAQARQNNKRDSLRRDVTSTTAKHVNKVNSKRQVSVKIDRSESSVTEEEFSEKRTVKNINRSRTLNFVARQMNQEYISVTHLTDVYFEVHFDHPDTLRRYELYELKDLLEDHVDDGFHDLVYQVVKATLMNIPDVDGKKQAFAEEDEESTPSETFKNYLRKSADLQSKIKNTPFSVEGIALGVERHTLQTAGVIVEALLGQANALDDYSAGLQAEEVRRRRLENQDQQMKVSAAERLLTIAESIQDDEHKLTAIQHLVGLYQPVEDEE